MLESMRDAPGTQREYETIYILRPETSAEQVLAVNTRVRKVIEDAQGRLVRVENWGKRKLAYEIKKQNKGIYLYWRYLAGAPLVAELERNLRMLDTVIRYLTVKIDEDVDPNARPSGVSEEVFSAASETRPDEEDYYLGRTSPRDDDEGDDEDDDEDGDSDRGPGAAAAAGPGARRQRPIEREGGDQGDDSFSASAQRGDAQRGDGQIEEGQIEEGQIEPGQNEQGRNEEEE